MRQFFNIFNPFSIQTLLLPFSLLFSHFFYLLFLLNFILLIHHHRQLHEKKEEERVMVSPYLWYPYKKKLERKFSLFTNRNEDEGKCEH
jgi:hypothetical protein